MGELRKAPVVFAAEEFAKGYQQMAAAIHAVNRANGWWPDVERNQYEMLALIHSEVSECTEALRHGNQDSDHIPPFSGAEEELADIIIRVMDMGEGFGYKVADAVIAKLLFNHTRAYRHGGKEA